MEEQSLENVLAMMEARMDEIVTRLKKSEEDNSNFKDSLERFLSQKMAEEQSRELSQKLFSNIGNAISSTEQQLDPEDPNLSNIYEEKEDEVNLSFRVNEEIVNASRLQAPNVVSRNSKVAADKDSKDKELKRADRRESVFRKLDRINSGVNDRVQVYKNTPSFDYLKLSKFDVASVMSFASGIDQFQSKHHLSVPAATLVSEDIKTKLLGINEIPRLTPANFYALDNKPLIQLLQKALRPTNVHDFRRQLNKNLSFILPKDYKPTVTNFFILHQQLLSFRVEFEQVYDFIADGNSLTNIPKCDNKDGGLIKIFVELIPHGIGRRMYVNLNTERYADIDDFLKAFYDQLRNFYKIAVEARQLNNVLYESTGVPSQSERLSSRTANITDPEHLMLVEQLLENLESEEPAGQLAFINTNKNIKPSSSTGAKTPLACFQMAIEGKCNREKCSYSHDRPVLVAYVQDLTAKIIKSPYAPRPRLQSETSGHGKTYQKQSTLVAESNESPRHVVNLNYSDSTVAEVARNEFLHSYPEAGMVSLMHRSGFLILNNGKRVPIKGMFDSGALHSSYIDPLIVKEHRALLEPDIIRIKGCVTLGDSKTSHQVNEAIEVVLEFKDDDGEIHRGRLKMVAFASGTDAIIGLPDISRVFGAFFLGMVRTAIDNPAIFEDRHPPMVRVVTSGPSSFNSLRYRDLKDGDSCSDDADYDDHRSEGSVSCVESYDPVDNDLWTEFWGLDYEGSVCEECSSVPTGQPNSDVEHYSYQPESIDAIGSFPAEQTVRELERRLLVDQLHRVSDISEHLPWHYASHHVTEHNVLRVDASMTGFGGTSEWLRPEVAWEPFFAAWAARVDEDNDLLPDLIPDSDSDDESESNDSDEDSDSESADCWPSNHDESDSDDDDSDDDDSPSVSVPLQQSTQFISKQQTLVQPWEHLRASAIEDDETAMPCSFPDFLAFTEIGNDAAVQVYLDLLDSHVCPEFQETTNIMQLLRTKGVKVFVPQNWEGVRVKPLHIDFIEGMPSLLKPRARPVNPKLFEHAHKEFLRLRTYIYVPFDGPVACPLVIAPKATAPFIRFCGDYTPINKYIPHWHTPMKNPQQTITDELVNHDAFGDADMSNAYHQLPIDEETSHKLSIQTPWGQVRPRFLPEGIPIGNAHLQKTMSGIFADLEWVIVIFDNILILANGFAELYERFNIFLDYCIRFNVTLKMAKTWLGFPTVKFFGYLCRKGSYELTQDRKDCLRQITFPTTLKAMQSFLGFALFFKPFMINYSRLAAPLHDMTRKDFSWDSKTWSVDYLSVFNCFKDACVQVMALHYHDPTKEKIVRCDACELGVGAALFQLATVPIGPPLLEPILCASEKFSDEATRWSTFEQEGYGSYYALKAFQYFLRGNVFILETDHNNLRWMELSKVPKIIRWVAFMQSFQFMVRHIPGKHNVVADVLSRFLGLFQHSIFLAEEVGGSVEPDPDSEIYNNSDIYMFSRLAVLDATDDEDLVTKVLKACHNSRVGHFGARRTYQLANKLFPGHRIPIRTVMEFVSSCAICQKYRIGMVDNLGPVVRHLKPDNQRSVVGYDTLEVSPRDKFGNLYLDVLVNHFTKFVKLYPKAEKTAVSTALSLFQYFCAYGICDVIMTDPGSDLKSEVIAHLIRYFGMDHRISLVDRHESNGVEGTNKQALRHIRVLTQEENIKDEWSSPAVLPIIENLLNNWENSETGVAPFQATFGTEDLKYMVLPEDADPKVRVHAYVQQLDNNLQKLRVASKNFQDELVRERTAKTPTETQNTFQPGDFVFFERDKDVPRSFKLAPDFSGPFEVVEQSKNDVQCRNLVYGNIKPLHVSRLKPFIGTRDEAYELAKKDTDQYEVDTILAYRGDPETRTTMEFLLQFRDGDQVWLPYSSDIFQMQQFETFCLSTPGLYFLQYSFSVAKSRIQAINRQPITILGPGQSIYVDIRTFGEHWYQAVGLPDMYSTRYVDKWTITGWKKEPIKLFGYSDVFNTHYILTHEGVMKWGRWFNMDANMVEVTPELLVQYPLLRE